MWCERVEGGDREKQVGEQPMTYQLQRVAPHRLQSFSQEAVDVVDSDVERLGNQLELQMNFRGNQLERSGHKQMLAGGDLELSG